MRKRCSRNGHPPAPWWRGTEIIWWMELGWMDSAWNVSWLGQDLTQLFQETDVKGKDSSFHLYKDFSACLGQLLQQKKGQGRAGQRRRKSLHQTNMAWVLISWPIPINESRTIPIFKGSRTLYKKTYKYPSWVELYPSNWTFQNGFDHQCGMKRGR